VEAEGVLRPDQECPHEPVGGPPRSLDRAARSASPSERAVDQAAAMPSARKPVLKLGSSRLSSSRKVASASGPPVLAANPPGRGSWSRVYRLFATNVTKEPHESPKSTLLRSRAGARLGVARCRRARPGASRLRSRAARRASGS
jgi:hypothetical protein